MTERAPPPGGEAPLRDPVLIIAGATDLDSRALSEVLRLPADGEVIIGRGRRFDGQVGTTGRVLIADALVSSDHLALRRAGARLEVRDLGSRNGTSVNGASVNGPTVLNDADVVLFGGHVAVVRYLSADDLEAIAAERRAPFAPVSATSAAMALVCRRLRALAPSALEVLITGETGVGKEVYARALHAVSGRSGPFVAVNCAAIPGELIESELFGYVRGAHSQANHSKAGLIHQAIGGTLFLDEIGDMNHGAQAKLLRFVQSRELVPLGATATIRADVRIVAATNRTDTAEGGPALRADLAARFGANPVRIPPLRDRPEEIVPLLGHFLRPSGIRALELAALRAACLYRWPGNVRELERVCREAVLTISGASRLGLNDLGEAVARWAAPAVPLEAAPVRQRRPGPSREVLEALLAEHRGSVSAVARALDRQWAVVWRLMQRYEIDVARFRR